MYNLKKKFIFVHPGKTAGTSIKHLITSRFNGKTGHPNYNGMGNEPLRVHIEDIEKHGYDHKDFFKFATIRNPWDRVVSWFFHRKELYGDNDFEFHVRNTIGGLLTEKYMFYQGNFVMDYVIKYENLENDVSFVMNKLGIDNYKLQKFNHDTKRPKDRNYQSYYNEETRDIVAKKFKWDIDTFNYTFD